MGVLAMLALGLGLAPPYPITSECNIGVPALKLLYLPGGDTGRIAIGGAPENLDRLLRGHPALIARDGREILLGLAERPTDGRNPAVALYTPREPLELGSAYELKSWYGSRVERRDRPLSIAPPVWNGTIEAFETPEGVSLRFRPAVGPLVRVVSGEQRSLISVAGEELDLGCSGCTESLDLRGGRAVVTVTVIDAWGRESSPRTFEVVQPRRMRGKACRARVPSEARMVSVPVLEPLAGWSVWHRLLGFVWLPFFLSYGVVNTAFALGRRRRRRIIARL